MRILKVEHYLTQGHKMVTVNGLRLSKVWLVGSGSWDISYVWTKEKIH